MWHDPHRPTQHHRFRHLARRRRVLRLQELCASALLIVAVLAAGSVSRYLSGIATTTCNALPRIIAEAQTRAVW